MQFLYKEILKCIYFYAHVSKFSAVECIVL